MLELVAAFTHFLDSHISPNEGGNWVRWRLKSNCGFYICSYYCVLVDLLPSVSLENWSVMAPR